MCVLDSLEKLDEKPGVALHHVGLQVGQCYQLIQQLNKENMVLFTEPPAIQLQKPVREREDTYKWRYSLFSIIN